MIVNPIEFKNDLLLLLDQRLLPNQEVVVSIHTIEETHAAIKDMIVRGAPCIGFTGILGMALFVKSKTTLSLEEYTKACTYLKSSRPTAVNLAYEIDRTLSLAKDYLSNGTKVFYQKLVEFGLKEIELSEKRNNQMADLAIAELTKLYGERPLTLMTHCNTGYLACGSLGTALGVISKLNKLGRVKHVYADETRPYMQGSRLTAYELSKENISHEIVCEGAASYVLKHKNVDAIFVGADRIVSNGDTANKVGTSTLAINAKYYNVPFYVVAPVSSFDLNLNHGDQIEIEMRSESEILEFKGQTVAPKKSRALNPSFDVTSSDTITGIFCEKGHIKAPYTSNLKTIIQS